MLFLLNVVLTMSYLLCIFYTLSVISLITMKTYNIFKSRNVLCYFCYYMYFKWIILLTLNKVDIYSLSICLCLSSSTQFWNTLMLKSKNRPEHYFWRIWPYTSHTILTGLANWRGIWCLVILRDMILAIIWPLPTP